jgi:ferredoxin-NADP reductase
MKGNLKPAPAPANEETAPLAIGTKGQPDGPYGSLTLHGNRSRPAVFIASGIGITPLMRIVRQTLHDRLPQVMTLVYLDRRKEDAAYLEELSGLEREHRGQFTGAIDAELMANVIIKPSRPIFYVAGPPGMVASTRQLLLGMGYEDDEIRSEDSVGTSEILDPQPK